MLPSDKAAVGVLLAVGLLALIVGLGTIVYAYGVVHPKLAQIRDRLAATAEFAERGLRALEAHDAAIAALDAPQQSTLATAHELPAVLEQSAYLSEHAAQTLARSAQTLRSVEEDMGFVLPDEAIRQNADALATTGRSLEGLAPMLYTLHEAADSLAGDLTQASAGAERLQQTLQRADVTLARAQAHLHQTRLTLEAANLPTEITRFAALLGSMFVVLAFVLLGLAGLWRRLTGTPPRRSPPEA